MTMRRRSAFTLVELLMVAAIAIMLAAMVLPQLQDTDGVHLIAAARMLRSDIELAQVMTISNPARPIVLRFELGDLDNDTFFPEYWLATAADPETPITRPGTGTPYHVEFGAGPASDARGVTLAFTGLLGETLGFNPQGGVDVAYAPGALAIKLFRPPDNRWIRLSISSITGTITETSGE